MLFIITITIFICSAQQRCDITAYVSWAVSASASYSNDTSFLHNSSVSYAVRLFAFWLQSLLLFHLHFIFNVISIPYSYFYSTFPPNSLSFSPLHFSPIFLSRPLIPSYSLLFPQLAHLVPEVVPVLLWAFAGKNRMEKN